MGKLIIDRFEGDVAVCVDAGGATIDIPRSNLPADAKTGATLVKVGESYRVDVEDTQTRKTRIADKMKSVFKD